ncbi:MAG: NAD(P)-dependent oxidoreductase, partial [Halobacteriales archaeon]|nr:NAD(P)-dependent oxidoreductase [Halobacteriales archaeon]
EQQARHEFRYWQGGELHGGTLGIIGLGEVGSRVAQLGQALEMTVIGTKRDPGSAPAAVDEALGPGDTDRVCARADYLVLACPLTEDTRGLIGETQLGTMPSDGVLINVARGPVVDEDALIRALQRSEIGGAALDVFTEEPLPGDSPLWDFSNVILTPHIAGSTPKYWDRLADIFAHNYTCYRDGEYDEMQNRAP